MEVKVENRIKCRRDTCPHADIRADVEEYKSLGGVCMVLVTIECEHGVVCRYENEEREA